MYIYIVHIRKTAIQIKKTPKIFPRSWNRKFSLGILSWGPTAPVDSVEGS